MKKTLLGLISIVVLSSCGATINTGGDTKVLKEIPAQVGEPSEIGGGEGNAKEKNLGR